MARALGLEGKSLQAVNQAYAELLQRLAQADPNVQLAIANSLWARRGVAFRPEFLERNRTSYGAEVTSLDFDDPGAASAINGWVEKATRGKIGEIVDRIDPMAVLFLINAIYFKGIWQHKFEKAQTWEEPFHLAGGGRKQVPMMTRTGPHAHLQGDGFQALRLPYGAGRVVMEIFLPDAGSGLGPLLSRLTPEIWRQWMPRFTEKPCLVKLPRFRMEYEVALKNTLKSLGMGVAFDPYQADLSGMSPEKLYINEVKHKSFVEVNEEGTEAAAVTSVEVRVLSARIEPEPVRFIVDRPFFFAIRDSQTGVLLFLGVVHDPA
jgi:serpin B